MIWSFSFELLPGEEIIEDSSDKKQSGLQPLYSVLLTNKRAIFRFDSLGSSLSQSLFYHEIEEIRPQKRLMVNYIFLKTEKKSHLINAPDAEFWSKKILDHKERYQDTAVARPVEKRVARIDTKAELMGMLLALKEKSVLTNREFEEKKSLVESMNL